VRNGPSGAMPTPVARRGSESYAPDFTVQRGERNSPRGKGTRHGPGHAEREETWPFHPRQESETPLLAVVKTLVKRAKSVGIVLERGARAASASALR